MNLWEQAVVFCKETDEAIRTLPDRLEMIAADPLVMAGKRSAIRQLKLMYGSDCFVHDIRKMSISDVNLPVQKLSLREDPFLNDLITGVLNPKNTSVVTARSFLVGCGCRMLSDPYEFFEWYKRSPRMRKACDMAIQMGPVDAVSQFKDIAAAKNLCLSLEESSF